MAATLVSGSLETTGESLISSSSVPFFYFTPPTSILPDVHEAYVAIKIMSTYVTEAQEVELSELEILQHIKAHAKAHPGGKHVARVLDSFTVTDHHGPHLCLVFEVLGTFRSSVYRPGNEMSVPIVKHVTKQLLLALDFLHSECEIIHAGKVRCSYCRYISDS